MASRILLRVIDEAIIPAVIVVVAKITAIAFFVYWLRLDWQFDTNALLPGIVFEDPQTALFVNSYSNLFLYLVVLVGLVWVLAKAYHFHETHVSPSFVMQLLSWNLTGLLSTSEEVFHQGVVWVSYLWLVTIMIGLNTWVGFNYAWIFAFCFVGSLLATWFLIADVEREISLNTISKEI